MKQNCYVWCDHCECETIICGQCNNNLCNGGSGIGPDGKKCKQCAEAYKEWMQKLEKQTGR